MIHQLFVGRLIAESMLFLKKYKDIRINQYVPLSRPKKVQEEDTPEVAAEAGGPAAEEGGDGETAGEEGAGK